MNWIFFTLFVTLLAMQQVSFFSSVDSIEISGNHRIRSRPVRNASGQHLRGSKTIDPPPVPFFWHPTIIMGQWYIFLASVSFLPNSRAYFFRRPVLSLGNVHFQSGQVFAFTGQLCRTKTSIQNIRVSTEKLRVRWHKLLSVRQLKSD